MGICKQNRWIRPAAVIFAIVLSGADDSTTTEESEQRLSEMTKRVNLLRAEFADVEKDSKLDVSKKPIFRYSDPARIDTDGTLWLWTADERPVACLCVFMARPPSAKWTYELTSLSDRPLTMSGRPRWTWKPRKQQRTWIEMTGKVAENRKLRLRQLRTLARQFEASQEWQGETYQLRLLPRPLYRYPDETQGVVDGGMFALAHGTNPEAFILIEAREDDSGKARWFASFARQSSAALTIKLADKTVWTAKLVDTRLDPDEPYFFAYGPDLLTE